MALDVNLKDSSSGTAAEVDASGNLLVTTPGYTATGAISGGGPAQGPAIFSENDPGTITGARYVLSPETDDDYRLRVAHDHILDRETFNYAAQNTGKHSHTFTTLTATVSTNGLLTNSGAITTTATGMTFGTHAEFPCGMTAQPVYAETNMSISVATNSFPSNTTIDVGMFRRGATTAFAPTDGAYFRFTSAGIQGVINNNGTETTSVFTSPTFAANENHLYGIIINEKAVEFWIDNVLYGEVDTPLANAQAFRSATLPWSMRHANTGTASSAVQALITDYMISLGGANYAQSLAAIGNRSLGSYQGLSGGTMGSLANYANSTNPTSAGGSNTAANVTGLGGQGAINAAAGGSTDAIMCSFQVPAGSTSAQGRRLAVTGCKISAVNLGAAVATTATTVAYSIAFGHTTVGLNTAETASFVTATTKAPRRIAMGFHYWPVGAVVGAAALPGELYMQFQNPIFVNPGEFIAVAMKFIVGTATGSQSIWYHVAFDYGWE
jgi:hypothetical protein